jgi:hypothetical protein
LDGFVVKLVRNAFTALSVWGPAVALGVAVYSAYPTRKKRLGVPEALIPEGYHTVFTAGTA